MAELFFFNKEGERISPVSKCTLTDGDLLTNYSAEGTKLKGYIDFGKPVHMDRVSYVRRGDGNAIMSGEDYEIFYWEDSRWKHHSSHTAVGIHTHLFCVRHKLPTSGCHLSRICLMGRCTLSKDLQEYDIGFLL